MKQYFISFGVLLSAFFPSLAFAGEGFLYDTWQSFMVFADNPELLEGISLWSTLIIAFATSMMVWAGSRKMNGGVFGSVLTFFSIGMTLIFLGAVTEIPWFQKTIDALYLKMTHDSLYIIGYIMMGLAASKLLKVIKGE